MNSAKLKNYPNALLKLFFERNNKSASTMSKLGNVFRNSKWSDLQIQNVKSSFISQYIYIWISLAAVFTILFLLSYSNPNISQSYYMVRLAVYDFCFNVTFSVSLILTTTYYLVLSILNQAFYDVTKAVVNNTSSNISDSVTNHVSNNTVSTDDMQATALLLHNLYNLKLRLDLANHSHLIDTYMHNLKNEGYATSASFNNQIIIYSLKSSDLSYNPRYLNSDHNYSTKLYTLPGITNMDYASLTPKLLSEISNLGVEVSESLFNPTTPMNMAKQERWLSKNSNLSYNLSSNNNAMLESKKLIGSSLSDPNLTDRNLWVSNLFENNNTPLTNLHTNINPLLSNYNFSEESREFFAKRYMFLINQQLLNLTANPNITSSNQVVTSPISNFDTLKSLSTFSNPLLNVLFSLNPTNSNQLIGSTTFANSTSDTQLQSDDANVLTLSHSPLFIQLNTTRVNSKYNINANYSSRLSN